MRKQTMTISVCLPVGGTEQNLSFTGRDAWALSALIEAGKKGCTPIDNPAPRWSAYVKNLRDAGITIETIYEPHSGPYSGTHGRYVLKSQLDVTRPFGPKGQVA
ncbi:winged helix domain-containing protein [Cohaesibacter intestini]|uniref:winged helix domain-containing protein n=1 Tax=Cohaesibacter intestini TaxID=2211145 RepID=UPI001FE2032A|nr:hypothetical protein [Cohaesibacter intestini]